MRNREGLRMSKGIEWFALSMYEQAELLQASAALSGKRAEILEKDIWLCLVLGILFNLPCRKPMAFKGGTSLSKVYQAIERFSEDIDITIDYRALIENPPNLSTLSNTKRNQLSKTLKSLLTEHIFNEVAPALQTALSQIKPNDEISIEVSNDGEKLWVYYPSAVENKDNYLRSSILIEFGGRNDPLPQEILTITPDLSTHITELTFPAAQVTVLSPMRTFWEKATLIHVECHRPQQPLGAERMSRHWYDLARLADHEIGDTALADLELLKNVLSIKETFFRASYSNYDKCMTGALQLIPEQSFLDALNKDYQAMLSAQMFYGDTLSFSTIIDRLSKLEHEINNKMKSTTTAIIR